VRNEVNRVAPAAGCAGLSAIADGLDRVPKAIRNGIAWCATEITGLPEFPARLLGAVITRAALHPVPLHAVAQGIRAVGAVSCAADDRLGQCQCARHLVGDEAETAVARTLKQVVDNMANVRADVSEMPGIVSEVRSPYDRFDSLDDDGFDVRGIGGMFD
jgi:hypothetical protein